jgi:hypothetical protein
MINPKDIAENAVEICTFLELSIVDKIAKKNPELSIPFSNIPELEWSIGFECSPWIEMNTIVRAHDTLFHSDWTWLMKVVDKIENEVEGVGAFTISTHAQIHENNEKIYLTHVHYGMPEHESGCPFEIIWMEYENSRIGAVYVAVLEFIKWYNNKQEINES